MSVRIRRFRLAVPRPLAVGAGLGGWARGHVSEPACPAVLDSRTTEPRTRSAWARRALAQVVQLPDTWPSLLLRSCFRIGDAGAVEVRGAALAAGLSYAAFLLLVLVLMLGDGPSLLEVSR